MDVPPLYPLACSPHSSKRCLGCGKDYPATLEYWHRNIRAADGLAARCRTCRTAAQRDYAATHTQDKALQRRAAKRRLRLAVFTHYCGGIPACACCGEMRYEFLALDHINGGGNKHRKSLGNTSYAVFRWLQEQGYPDGYRVLCYNCNMARAYHGLCPHEREREAGG